MPRRDRILELLLDLSTYPAPIACLRKDHGLRLAAVMDALSALSDSHRIELIYCRDENMRECVKISRKSWERAEHLAGQYYAEAYEPLAA